MNRIRSLDWARGFTVLFIPAIHTGMLYSNLSVHTSALGYLLTFIAEGPGGQLLMLLMGFSFTFKETHHTKSVLTKSILLIAMGYALNALKFVLPNSVGLLPDAVLQELNITEGNTRMQLLAMGDILHFSGIALLILHAIYRYKYQVLLSLTLILLITLYGPQVWDLQITNPIFNYILKLATGQPPEVFFPLLPWLVYPLLGLVIGHYYKQSPDQTFTICGSMGLFLVFTGLFAEMLIPIQYDAGFYRTPPAATCWHMGIVLLTLYTWNRVSNKIKDNAFTKVLDYSSRHITSLYIIQWVMICWMLPVFGFRQLGLTTSFFVMIAMTINTYLLSFTIQIYKQQYASRKQL